MVVEQNFYALINKLKHQYPRLVVLMGTEHTSEETEIIKDRILKDANVGFFEAAPDMLGRDNVLSRQAAESFVRTLETKRWPPDKIAPYKCLTLPETAVLVDEPKEKRNKAELPGLAIDRLDQDKVPDNHPVKAAISTIWLDRLENRLMSSNKAMAKNIGDYLDNSYPSNAPFFAVGTVGRAHLRPSTFREKNPGYDMKKVLEERGFKVVTIDFVPVPKLDHPYSQRLGYYLDDAQHADPSIDYTMEVADPRAYTIASASGKNGGADRGT